MTTLLVTNDDGVDSPALLPLVRALGQIPSVDSVNALVPCRERSWISKSITRFGDIQVLERKTSAQEPPIWTASGTPADCANLGIHSVFPERPDLLVSGINIGLNHGMAFMLGSGTVGAATEGAIAGIPAVAFSIGAEGGHGAFVDTLHSEAGREVWRNAAEVAVDIVKSLLRVGFPERVDILNVNLPRGVSLATPRVFTEIAQVGYDALFSLRRADGREDELENRVYGFDYGGLKERRPSTGPSDREVLAAGKISISAIQFPRTVEVSDPLREALAK